MKKIFLAAACLLTLTACSPTSQKQPKQEAKTSQSQSASKSQKEEIQTKNYFSERPGGNQVSLSFSYQEDKLTSFTFTVERDIPEEEQDKSRAELRKQYEDEIKSNPNYKDMENMDGINWKVGVSADKKSTTQSLSIDLTKADLDKLTEIFEVEGESENNLITRLKSKPQDVFKLIEEQGFVAE